MTEYSSFCVLVTQESSTLDVVSNSPHRFRRCSDIGPTGDGNQSQEQPEFHELSKSKNEQVVGNAQAGNPGENENGPSGVRETPSRRFNNKQQQQQQQRSGVHGGRRQQNRHGRYYQKGPQQRLSFGQNQEGSKSAENFGPTSTVERIPEGGADDNGRTPTASTTSAKGKGKQEERRG